MIIRSDVLLPIQDKYDLKPVYQAIEEGRVINPRGIEPLDVKSIFEVITDCCSDRFHRETVARTPWTRRFFPRSTTGPDGMPISDLINWTRSNWKKLVLKPAKGYSGHGVRVGAVDDNLEEALELALSEGDYIVQATVPLSIWAEEIPTADRSGHLSLKTCQTDFRCLIGPGGSLGFICRFGGVPTNVGSGGGVQPLAVLKSDLSIGEAVARINDSIMNMNPADLCEVVDGHKEMARAHEFTYVLGPIPIALRPRIISEAQISALNRYSGKLWVDCLTLEAMWMNGELEDSINSDGKELDIAQLQPWKGSRAIIASDGLFNFGANPISKLSR